MRGRWIAWLFIALLAWSAQTLAEETTAYSLMVEEDALTLWEGELLLNQWEVPQDKDATADVYYDEWNAYVRVTFENAEGQPEEQVAPLWLRVEWGEGLTLETFGFEHVRQHLLSPEQIDAVLISKELGPLTAREADGAQAALDMLPCGLHTAYAPMGDAAAPHSGLLPCGQAFVCDEAHLHMVYGCGRHYSCQGGDPAEHAPYESCDHFVCEGMAHPLLDCRVHSPCDADPLAHALRGCGHPVCVPCGCAEQP